jgi:hypothetical protein
MRKDREHFIRQSKTKSLNCWGRHCGMVPQPIPLPASYSMFDLFDFDWLLFDYTFDTFSVMWFE